MAAAKISSPGTRPEGAQDEQAARRFVRDTFSFIAPKYDLLNHTLSLSMDKLWRRRTARLYRHVLARPDARVLDICCGTGDLAIALQRRAVEEARKQNTSKGATIWGTDFARPMLELAQRKIARETRRRATRKNGAGQSGGVTFGAAIDLIEGDALCLPFPDASLDLVTTAFGFRNLVNYEASLREIFRVLRPGGEVAILEFGAPHVPVMAPIYRFYFKHILPRIGGAVSGSSAAYSYLPASVAKFPSHDELVALMTRCGYAGARYRLWTAGIVALHTGRKS